MEQTTPAAKLEVAGNIKADHFQMTSGGGIDKILQSDASGNASWVASPTPAHYVGEVYGGGIVFYVYDNGQHGLIAADSDAGFPQWYNGTYTSSAQLVMNRSRRDEYCDDCSNTNGR